MIKFTWYLRKMLHHVIWMKSKLILWSSSFKSLELCIARKLTPFDRCLYLLAKSDGRHLENQGKGAHREEGIESFVSVVSVLLL